MRSRHMARARGAYIISLVPARIVAGRRFLGGEGPLPRLDMTAPGRSRPPSSVGAIARTASSAASLSRCARAIFCSASVPPGSRSEPPLLVAERFKTASLSAPTRTLEPTSTLGGVRPLRRAARGSRASRSVSGRVGLGVNSRVVFSQVFSSLYARHNHRTVCTATGPNANTAATRRRTARRGSIARPP